MFDEPQDDDAPEERARTVAELVKDKSDEFRMHAELCAVFEGCRKFDAQVNPKLPAETARDCQRAIGKLEKAKPADSPLLPDDAAPEARRILLLPDGPVAPAGSEGPDVTPPPVRLTTGDYHIHRRPGEVMIVRWLAGAEVEAFYERLQAHFDAALHAFREDERSSKQWKQDPATLEYLDALDKIDLKMADRYLRPILRQHPVFVLSTQAADELDIIYFADQIMGLSPADVVGRAAAPTDEPTEQDRAWFFKLFSLRGTVDGVERMCFFAYLQKADEGF